MKKKRVTHFGAPFNEYKKPTPKTPPKKRPPKKKPTKKTPAKKKSEKSKKKESTGVYGSTVIKRTNKPREAIENYTGTGMAQRSGKKIRERQDKQAEKIAKMFPNLRKKPK